MGAGRAAAPQAHARPARSSLSLPVNIAGGTFGPRRVITTAAATVPGNGRLGNRTYHAVAIGACYGIRSRPCSAPLSPHGQFQGTVVGYRVKIGRDTLVYQDQP